MSRVPNVHLFKSRVVIKILLVSVIFATIYGVIQYNIRSAADDPQLQISQDEAQNLTNGMTPQGVVGNAIPIDKSLSPFTIVYFRDGTVAASSAALEGKVPKLPIGVLKSTTEKKSHRVTWEPKKGVRIATVVTATPTYYVLAGRNIREIERREQTSLFIVVAGWLVAVSVLLLTKKR